MSYIISSLIRLAFRGIPDVRCLLPCLRCNFLTVSTGSTLSTTNIMVPTLPNTASGKRSWLDRCSHLNYKFAANNYWLVSNGDLTCTSNYSSTPLSNVQSCYNYLSVLEQKIAHHLHEPFCLLQLWDMGRVGKLNPSDFGNILKVRFDGYVMCFVVTPIQK